MAEQLTTEALDQRMNALARGNERRIKRAQDKKLMKRGQVDSAQILRGLPVHWKSAKLIELLLATPRVGRVKAHNLCKLHGMSSTRRLDELTPRQRELLARTLDTKRRNWEHHG